MTPVLAFALITSTPADPCAGSPTTEAKDVCQAVTTEASSSSSIDSDASRTKAEGAAKAVVAEFHKATACAGEPKTSTYPQAKPADIAACAATMDQFVVISRNWESDTFSRIDPSGEGRERVARQRVADLARGTRQGLERLQAELKSELIDAIARCRTANLGQASSAGACVVEAAHLETLQLELDQFDPAGLRAASEQMKALGGGTLSDEAKTLLETTAKFALKRAKRAALGLVHDRIAEEICGLRAPGQGAQGHASPPLFPATCRFIEDTSLETIAKDPRRLQPALIADLVGIAKVYGLKQLGNNAASVQIEAAIDLVARVRARQVPKPSHVDSQALLTATLPLRASATKPSVALGLEAAALYVARQGKLDVAAIIEDLGGELPGNPSDAAKIKAHALQVALLGVRGLGLAREPSPSDEHDAWTAAVEAVMEIGVTEADSSPAAEALRDLVMAIADENVPAAISAAATVLQGTVNARDCSDSPTENRNSARRLTLQRCRALEKTAALLSGVASYAATYTSSGKEGKSEADLQAARNEALEDLVDAATRRSNRHGDWVFSLGIPVGFSAGYQWTDAGGSSLMAPQLELPLGLGVQMLPGHRFAVGKVGDRKRNHKTKRWYADGVHVFVPLLDLGQFVAYRNEDTDGNTSDATLSRPRWDSIFGPGLQVGWGFGRPDNMFTVAASVRYAPTLFASKQDALSPDDDAGALRLGLSLSYYVSLFDFN